ncbi:Rieske 2Fe-2S domain-containing protein [Phaeobacter sp. QD34_3]|uniref:Rieske 2Fe-2S domain-containing protein n=1 Tax=unclassified Phaeobacter TaxID=2621772 RepID=UPI00237F4C93|nr:MULTISPECIES: Rieske 2Fe-2S domain-containing protein [unclassified Phaeobacter]MDE4134910.1 Rieske 2Fe-2S domain-containing protein [Phaeobacter sp. QD34_3]MDE4138540.1 Rieske 2Fe-2S domain-containing protein [Phaeobacter sp. QD34_24]MDE4175751.1 Rieske 2Fe-2S domain-containing protein [Phaeobacter sp. PT47_59]
MPAKTIVVNSSRLASDWAYIANRSDLVSPRPLLPVTIDSRPYVLFMDEEGELGLIGRHCPHRGADLCYGRLENNGIRCPFHGWHFDRTGQCVETPAEPEGSKMYRAIKTPMVPLYEQNGAIYAYVGEGEPTEPFNLEHAETVQ